MRIFLLAFAISFSLTSSAVSSAMAKPILLLTGFEPFGGAAENNSWRVVQALEKSSALRTVYDVRICLLPVEYDRGATIAMDCYAGLPRAPVAVFSFGEARCQIQLERRYANLDDTPGFPDNAGVERSSAPIDPRGPDARGPSLNVSKMMNTVRARDRSLVIFSDSAGNYVCNNTAYHLAGELEGKGGFAFIHVPNTACPTAESNPARLSRMIAAMILAK